MILSDDDLTYAALQLAYDCRCASERALAGLNLPPDEMSRALARLDEQDREYIELGYRCIRTIAELLLDVDEAGGA